MNQPAIRSLLYVPAHQERFVAKAHERQADAIITCTNEADVTSKLLAIGVVPKSMTTPEFGAFIADETEKWAKVVRFADMKVD